MSNAITEKQYNALKAEVADAKKKADRAQGALDATVKRLKEDFGCKSVKEAKTKLEALELAALNAEKAFEAAFNKYQDEWAEADDDD